jgi:hypothetical protein
VQHCWNRDTYPLQVHKEGLTNGWPPSHPIPWLHTPQTTHNCGSGTNPIYYLWIQKKSDTELLELLHLFLCICQQNMFITCEKILHKTFVSFLLRYHNHHHHHHCFCTANNLTTTSLSLLPLIFVCNKIPSYIHKTLTNEKHPIISHKLITDKWKQYTEPLHCVEQES